MTADELKREAIAYTFFIVAAFSLPDPWGLYFALLVLAGWMVSHKQETDQIVGWLRTVGTGIGA